MSRDSQHTGGSRDQVTRKSALRESRHNTRNSKRRISLVFMFSLKVASTVKNSTFFSRRFLFFLSFGSALQEMIVPRYLSARYEVKAAAQMKIFPYAEKSGATAPFIWGIFFSIYGILGVVWIVEVILRCLKKIMSISCFV